MTENKFKTKISQRMIQQRYHQSNTNRKIFQKNKKVVDNMNVKCNAHELPKWRILER